MSLSISSHSSFIMPFWPAGTGALTAVAGLSAASAGFGQEEEFPIGRTTLSAASALQVSAWGFGGAEKTRLLRVNPLTSAILEVEGNDTSFPSSNATALY